MINKVIEYLSTNIRNVLNSQEKSIYNDIYEIRIRINYPIYIKTRCGNYFIGISEKSIRPKNNYYIINKNDIASTLSLLTSNSIHAYEKEIRKGYITIEGGHRAGLGGDCIYENDEIVGFKSITSINIRIAREYTECSKKLLKHIIRNSNSIYNTLIAGPPLSGKTTCIRDITRIISDGCCNPMFAGCDVSVIDERGEIAAVYNGYPQFNVGYRTDVLSYCMKKQGFEMSIRSLSPKVIISDELGSSDDYNTVQYALKSGVNVISTAHCYDLEDLKRNTYLKDIIDAGFIERIIVLSTERPISVSSVYDNIEKRVIVSDIN